MNCREVEETDILDDYLVGRLDEPERDAFEKHYFECDSCFARVQDVLAMQQGLQTPPVLRARDSAVSRRMWAWIPALAMLALIFAVGIWSRLARQKSHYPTAVSSQSQPAIPPQSQTTMLPLPSLDQLAKVEPPPYTPVVLRDAEDKSNETFRKAMEPYLKGNYARAIPGLRAAAQASPRSAKLDFYLGACYLLTDQTDLAIESLRKTISVGDPVYGEEAQFYLAKSYLKKGQLSEAKTELQRTIRFGGDRKIEAEEILRQLPE